MNNPGLFDETRNVERGSMNGVALKNGVVSDLGKV